MRAWFRWMAAVAAGLTVWAGGFAAAVAAPPRGAPMTKVGAACTCKGKQLWGRVQVVTSFPDLRVQVVTSFPDLRVQVVTSFPDRCGRWQFVTSFPDLKVQFVTSFPDVKIQYVDAFPGVR